MKNAFKKITLPNGLRVILVPRASSVAASMLILVVAGSEYETKKTNGLSHFLEHMTFKGTERRPRPGMIAEELASLGAQNNAFTSREYTGYWAKVAAPKFSKIVDIVGDLYLNPLFAPEEIEKERGVIMEESNMYDDTPMRRVHDEFLGLMYGDQPAGWKIEGEKKNIRELGRADLVAYRAARYTAPATVITIAGKFDGREVSRQVWEMFGGLPRRRAPRKTATVERKAGSPRVALKFKESDQSHLVLGFPAWNVFDERRWALQVLGDILGGGMSSRLFKKVREELGAAYYIGADDDLSLDHGLFSVSAGADRTRVLKVIGAIIEELRRIKSEPVPEAELRRSKDHMIGGFLLGLETADDLAGYYGGQEIITRKPLPPETVVDRINSVTAAEVRSAARTIFRNDGMDLAIIGPYRDKAPFKKILTI